jgi:hypothetical protein
MASPERGEKFGAPRPVHATQDSFKVQASESLEQLPAQVVFVILYQT